MRAVIVVVGLGLGACDVLLPIEEQQDAAQEASQEAGPPPGTTFTCGPSLTCSLANPNLGCCVLIGAYDARAPESYGYECVSEDKCALDNGADGGKWPEIHCDNGSECPTTGDASDVCCWPSAPAPTTTYCFSQTAMNCAYELCDPDAARPCINVKHPGYVCVSAAGILAQAPLGYNVCVPPDGG